MSTQQKACNKQHYQVTMAQLRQAPLSCPMDDMEIWDAHPKIFLPIMKTGKATCSYCNAEFIIPNPSIESSITSKFFTILGLLSLLTSSSCVIYSFCKLVFYDNLNNLYLSHDLYEHLIFLEYLSK